MAVTACAALSASVAITKTVVSNTSEGRLHDFIKVVTPEARQTAIISSRSIGSAGPDNSRSSFSASGQLAGKSAIDGGEA